MNLKRIEKLIDGLNSLSVVHRELDYLITDTIEALVEL